MTWMKAILVCLLLISPSLPAASEEALLTNFKRAAIEHSRFQACFNSKLKSGFCRFGQGDTSHIRRLSGEQLEQRISLRLSLLSREQYRTAALVYFEAPDGSFAVFLFDHSGLRAGSIAASVDMEEAVSGMRDVLGVDEEALRQRAGAPVNAAPRHYSPQSVSLADISRLLLPLSIGEQITQQRYDRILILPSTWTGAVPFPALELPDGRDLIDASAIVILPDLDALILPLDIEPDLLELAAEGLTFDGAGSVLGTSLVIGDPHYAPYRGSQLARLPGAHAEASAVAELIGTDAESVLTEGAATHDAVVSALARFEYQGGIIYFASHGISSDENPMDESLIALSERHLRAREIRDLEFRLNHPLVVLSACQTGLGKQFGGGSFGLLRAWYHAGAGQVIGSLWNVSDQGTKDLMVEFSRALTSGEERPEEALRKAMREVRRTYSDNPAIWASFYVFGNPARQNQAW